MKNETFSIQIVAPGNANAAVVLEGQLTVKNAAIIKTDLLSAINSSQTLRLIVKNVTKLDLAILQILIAVQKSAAKVKKILLIDFEYSDYTSSVIHNSGLQHYIMPNSTVKN